MTDLVIEGFSDREFAVDELTQTINKVPNNYGLVTQLGIFPEPVPLSTTYVRLETQNWVLNLLPATERGGPGTKGTVGKRSAKLFEVPQITHEDEIKVSDVQNLRAFGSFAPKMLEDLVAEKLLTMANKHFITHEWYRVNVLQGKMLDSDGSTMIDYFQEFGITRPVAAFTQSISGSVPPIAKKLRAVKRHMEKSLKGEVMSHIIALASQEFMEMLFADAEVKSVYNYAMNSPHPQMLFENPILNDRRSSFTYQGVTFVEYVGEASAPNTDGTFTTRRFIPAGDAIFFPLGTQTTARQYVAPGDFEEAHNMPGQLFYAKEARDKFGRWRELMTQSNLLVMWNRPELLVRGSVGDSGDTIGAL